MRNIPFKTGGQITRWNGLVATIGEDQLPPLDFAGLWTFNNTLTNSNGTDPFALIDSSWGAYEFVPGKIGMAVDTSTLVGADWQAPFGCDASVWNICSGTSAWSISFWMINSISGIPFIQLENNGDTDPAWTIGRLGDLENGQLNVEVRGVVQWVALDTLAYFNTEGGAWNHIVYTNNGGSGTGAIKVYVNGNLLTWDVEPAGPANLGTVDRLGVAPGINGLKDNSTTLDALYVYDRELSFDEVQRLYYAR